MDITINRIRLADPGQLFGIAGEIAKRFAGEGDYKGAIIAIGEAYDRAQVLLSEGMSKADHAEIIRMLQTDVEDLVYEVDMMKAHAESVAGQIEGWLWDLYQLRMKSLSHEQAIWAESTQDPEDGQ